MSEAGGWEIPGVIEQPAKAGDILVQDMMILHGSQVKQTPGVRRTIYVELRPAAGVTESGAQSERWNELRQRWMGLVARRAEASDWPDDWRDDLANDLSSDDEEIARILSVSEPPIPAVYCHQTVKVAGYPFSADLQEGTDEDNS